ncbi:MAG: type II secretion system minor pseudopilin GspJ [Pseudomonadota bacterium]
MVRTQPHGVSHGFTLVEVLVGVLIFSLLASTAYVGLNTLIEANAVQRERAQAFAELQRSVAALDRDLRQLIHRAARRPDQTTAPAVSGSPNRLIATRAGWYNPGQQARSQLQRFEWRWQADRLLRGYWSVTDPAVLTPPIPHLQLDAVDGFTLRYRDGQGQWHSRWPVDGGNTRLPSAIEFRLDSRQFGSITRLIVL